MNVSQPIENPSTSDRQPNPKRSPSPILVLGVISLCSVLATVILCAGTVFAVRTPGALSFIYGKKEDVVTEFSSDPTWEIKLDDRFKDNKNGWDRSLDQEKDYVLKRTIEDGKFTWNFHVKDGWNFWDWPQSKTSYSDFIAAMDVRHPFGSGRDGYGLVFRLSAGNYYLFQVDDNGNFGAWVYNQKKYSPLLDWQKAYLIKPGEVNQVAVKAIGDDFTFYINGQQVGQASDRTLATGAIGIYLSPSELPDRKRTAAPPDENYPEKDGWLASQYEITRFLILLPKNGARNGGRDLLTLQPKAGQLVYMSNKDGNEEIYTVDTQGRNSVRLTNDPAADYSPRWSPDGKRIAFVSERSGNADIFIMDRDGAGLTRATDNPMADIDPAWSPDGKQLVFCSNRSGYGEYDIYILDIASGKIERLTQRQQDAFPDWSPDGKSILFQSTQNGKTGIYAIDIATKKETRLTQDITYKVSRPKWSPDGSSYLQETDVEQYKSGIVISQMATGKMETVLPASVSNLWPAWSPDGSQIVFVSYRSGPANIYIISRDGKSIYQVTTDGAVEGMVDWTAE